MKNYQDLEALGLNEQRRMEFIELAIKEQENSEDYKIASDAEQYYAKKNVTISKFQRFLYSVSGQRLPDIFSANYKLKTGFFNRFIKQQVQYVLSNGVTFAENSTKEKLGRNFDNVLQSLAKKAAIDGKAFGFWNYDHLEVFSYAKTDRDPGFVPLYDEDTGTLRAGIRYWDVAGAFRCTLYEPDGYTEYIRRKDQQMEVKNEKRAYIQTQKKTEIGGVEEIVGSNYPGFPIIPFYANDLKQSEIVGIRESIDCYDFIKSGLANDIDDTAGFYWTLKNTGGMDDIDLARFVERMKVVRASVLDADVEAEAHTLDIPTQAREAMLDRLRSDLYEDFMLLDIEKALSGNITATGIRLAYQAQDDKCGDFEYCIRDFIGKLLALVGIQDEPSFQWNRVANQTEETNMVLSAANYLDDEAVLKHLPWITPEEATEIMKRRAADELTRVTDPLEE